MKVNILIFGQLTEITGKESLEFYDVADTASLIALMIEKYPALNQSKYIIAVDKQVINDNTTLHDNSTVAFMPAFSGG